MRHIKAGTQRFVAAGNGNEHSVMAEPFKASGAHDVGIAGLHVRMELVKFGIVSLTVVGIVDGFALDRLRQTRDNAAGVQIGIVCLAGKKVGNGFHAFLSSR